MEKKTQPSLREMSSVLQTVAASFSKIYFVVDALDECRETEGTRTTFIQEIYKLPDTLHLLCTSRPLVDIEKIFGNHPHLEIHASADDIQTYLRSRIRQFPRLKNHVLVDIALENTIVHVIESRASGVYAFVYF